MRDVTLIRNIELGEQGLALDVDFHSKGALCALIKTDFDRMVVRLDHTSLSVPDQWAPYVKQIRWLGDNAVILWPTTKFTYSDRKSYVGVMSLTELSTIISDFPLDVFADKNFIVCTLSEERILSNVDLAHQSDFISIFYKGKKIGSFVEYLVDQFPDEIFLEVVHGVLDGASETFWFTAYRTDYIWCLSFKDGIKVKACSLGCRLGDVRAISCKDNVATVITLVEDRLAFRTYLKTANDVTFGSEIDVSSTNDTDWLKEALSSRSGRIAGLRGNLISFINQSRAVLVAF